MSISDDEKLNISKFNELFLINGTHCSCLPVKTWNPPKCITLVRAASFLGGSSSGLLYKLNCMNSCLLRLSFFAFLNDSGGATLKKEATTLYKIAPAWSGPRNGGSGSVTVGYPMIYVQNQPI